MCSTRYDKQEVFIAPVPGCCISHLSGVGAGSYSWGVFTTNEQYVYDVMKIQLAMTGGTAK